MTSKLKRGQTITQEVGVFLEQFIFLRIVS